MRYITMTYELAMACGWDAGNRSMREAGRTKWSRADFNASVREFNSLWDGDKLTGQPRRES
jgi:hypothetical protein